MTEITLYGGPLDGEVRKIEARLAAQEWILIWSGPPSKHSYRKLRIVDLSACPEVRYLWVSEDVRYGSLNFSRKG